MDAFTELCWLLSAVIWLLAGGIADSAVRAMVGIGFAILYLAEHNTK